MPGIVVGVDGSDHSRSALEWAMKEAAIRHTPLTVLTVQQAIRGYSGTPVAYPGDEALAERARQAAQDAADKALAQLGDSGPASVTVQAVLGLPAEELLSASRDADMLVVGSRGTGGFARLLMGSVSSQVTHHASCPVVIIHSPDHK
jgi:nucleotide-binding universal stress UspA family protein